MKKLILFNSIFFAVVLGVGFGIFYFMPPPVTYEYQATIDEVTKQSIELLGEMNKYLTAVAFGIIGILGNILIGQVRLKHKENGFTTILFSLSLALSLCSVFFGYLAYTKLFEAVSHHFFTTKEKQITYTADNQFNTLLISAFLFVWYIFNSYFYAAKKQ